MANFANSELETKRSQLQQQMASYNQADLTPLKQEL
jgi:hypothetical protein